MICTGMVVNVDHTSQQSNFEAYRRTLDMPDPMFFTGVRVAFKQCFHFPYKI